MATPVIERLQVMYPNAELHFLLRKGNEGLLEGHPLLKRIWIWDKRPGGFRKFLSLLGLARKVRAFGFDAVYNLHRFASSGLITAFSGAEVKAGFDKNPWSSRFNRVRPHQLPYPSVFGIHYQRGTSIVAPETEATSTITTPTEPCFLHEVQRNLLLVDDKIVAYKAPNFSARPKLYPSKEQLGKAKKLTAEIRKRTGVKDVLVFAPASVWFTKQWPEKQWSALLDLLPPSSYALLVGAPTDSALVERIIGSRKNAANLCGKLSLIETAAVMGECTRVVSNDSAPMHLASAVNTPTTAIFCATRPSFGFGPLAEASTVVEADVQCCSKSIHGEASCSEGSFRCGFAVTPALVLATIVSASDSVATEKTTSTVEESLHAGGLLLHETDTVLGLACDATRSDAVAKIYAIKKRDPAKPLLILCADEAMRNRYANGIGKEEEAVVQELEREAKEAGIPLTIIFPKAKGLASNLLAENGSIAARIPSSESLRKLIQQFGKPLASTSANLSGEAPVTFLAELDGQLEQQVDFTLSLPKSESPTGKPSRLVKITAKGIEQLRD